MIKQDSSFIVLYSTNITQTHDFYQSIGLDIKEYEDDKVVVEIGSLELHFILYSTEPFQEYKYIATPDNYGHGVIFYVETNDIVTDSQLIEQQGGTIKAPIFENQWGCKECLFEDPNGYNFALYQ
ncbi:VOC family protein [candidate division WWE3 bacterium]|uniref:VOC family protein n=1 Tax=candidate division WWE3 bacterium TaxID=2053526 RepID=A0A955LW32_UNCKA|nr:VOC family protein [candidate division WWE3 bacterium]